MWKIIFAFIFLQVKCLAMEEEAVMQVPLEEKPVVNEKREQGAEIVVSRNFKNNNSPCFNINEGNKKGLFESTVDALKNRRGPDGTGTVKAKLKLAKLLELAKNDYIKKWKEREITKLADDVIELIVKKKQGHLLSDTYENIIQEERFVGNLTLNVFSKVKDDKAEEIKKMSLNCFSLNVMYKGILADDDKKITYYSKEHRKFLEDVLLNKIDCGKSEESKMMRENLLAKMREYSLFDKEVKVNIFAQNRNYILSELNNYIEEENHQDFNSGLKNYMKKKEKEIDSEFLRNSLTISLDSKTIGEISSICDKYVKSKESDACLKFFNNLLKLNENGELCKEEKGGKKFLKLKEVVKKCLQDGIAPNKDNQNCHNSNND